MNKKTILTAFPTFRRLPVAFLLALLQQWRGKGFLMESNGFNRAKTGHFT